MNIPTSDSELESVLLAFWKAREPGFSEVSITVRRAGEVVRYVLVPNDERQPRLRLIPAAGVTSATALAPAV